MSSFWMCRRIRLGLAAAGLAAFLAGAGGASRASGADWNKDVRELHRARDRRQMKPCLNRGERMLKTYASDLDKVREIFWVMADACRRVRNWKQALAVYKRVQEKFGDHPTQRRVLTAIADTQRDAQQWKPAIAAYRDLIKRFPDQGADGGYARWQIGYILKDRLRKYKEAIAELEEVEKADPKNAKHVSSALAGIGDCFYILKEYPKAYRAYHRVMEQYPKEQNYWVMRNVKRNAGQAILKSKDWKEAIAFFTKFEAVEKDYALRSEMAYNLVRALHSAGKKADAHSACVRAQSRYPSEASYLYECQRQIVALWNEEHKYAEALAASKLLFDLAWDENHIVQACSEIAARLKAVDGHLDRANAFLKFQKFGPNGPNGKPGGGDDLSNPLAKVPYPSDPQRMKVLQTGLEKTGDSALAARQRGLLRILMGQPKAALKEFQAQFRICSENLVQRAAQEWILIGVKAARGHATGLKPFYEWLNYGSAGKDGKGKARNPFEAIR